MIMILKHDFFSYMAEMGFHRYTRCRIRTVEGLRTAWLHTANLFIYFCLFLQRLELAMEHFVLLPQRAFGALTFCEQVRMFSTLCTDWHSNMEHINIKSYSIFQQHARVVLMCYTLFCNEYALLTFSILFYPILFLVKDCCCCYIIYKFKCCKIL